MPAAATSRFVVALLAAHWLICLAFFVAMPLQSLYLAQRFNLGAAFIGFIVGVCPLIFAVLGSFTGVLADRYGRRRLCALGLAGFIAAYGLLALARAPWHVVLAGIVFGLAKACFEPSFRALLLAMTPLERKPLVLKLRYINYCLGASMGPAVGAWLFHRGNTLPFVVATALLLTASLVASVALWSLAPTPESNAVLVRRSLALLRREPALAWITLAGFLLFAALSLFESMLPLVLRIHSSSPEVLFAKLLTLNAVAAMLLQWPLEAFGAQRKPQSLLLCGCAFLMLGLGCWGAGPGGTVWVLGTLLFAAGEATVYANLELLIDRMAPRAWVATYFGVSDLRYFGFVAGPWVGGVLLQHGGAAALFTAGAGAAALAAGAVVLCDRRLGYRRGLDDTFASKPPTKALTPSKLPYGT